MRNFLKNHGIALVFLAVVIAVIMAISSALMGGSANVISNVVGIVSLPMQKSRHRVYGLGRFGVQLYV